MVMNCSSFLILHGFMSHDVSWIFQWLSALPFGMVKLICCPAVAPVGTATWLVEWPLSPKWNLQDMTLR